MSPTSPMPPAVRAAVSWSGGKDSCLALLRAADAGLRVETLLTMADPGGLSKSHALPEALIQAQARAMGLHLMAVETDSTAYATVFGHALAQLGAEGITHIVFGDIDLQAHRDWLESACRNASLEPVFPLWGLTRAAVAREIIARGLRAMVVCVDTRWLDAGFCGEAYDEAFLARLPQGVCPCGEGGEFHTFVWDAPCFEQPLWVSAGELRRMASVPPLAPTELVFQTPLLRHPPSP